MLTDFVSFLKANDAINAIIQGRVNPDILAEASSLPAIVYTILDIKYEHDISGQMVYIETRLEIECWAMSKADSLGLAAAIRSATDGFIGFMGASLVQGILIEEAGDRDRAVYGDRQQYCHVLKLLIM